MDIDHTTTHSGAETEELHFMLVAGSQLIAGTQANFPRSREIVRLSANGLDGSRQIDLLLRFWPRNANYYECPGQGPHVVSSPPFATEPCGVLNESRCALGTSGTNTAIMRFFKSSISGLDPMREITAMRWHSSDGNDTVVAFEGVGCNVGLPVEVCIESAVAYGINCTGIRLRPGGPGDVLCSIPGDYAMQLGSVPQSSLALRRGTGPHRKVLYDARTALLPAEAAHPVDGSAGALANGTCCIVTIGVLLPGSNTTGVLEGSCFAMPGQDSLIQGVFTLRLATGFGQSAPEMTDADASGRRVDLVTGSDVVWLGDADGDGNTQELLVGDAVAG